MSTQAFSTCETIPPQFPPLEFLLNDFVETKLTKHHLWKAESKSGSDTVESQAKDETGRNIN